MTRKKSENPIAGKILLQGSLLCRSPLHIGNGNSERSEMDLLLDSGGRPFIPATSLVGVLKQTLENTLSPNERETHRQDLERFWGYTKEQEGQQSALRCSDLALLSETAEIALRDGIKIDSANGIVEGPAKYDYEVLERGSRFCLNMELSYRKNDGEFVKKMAATLYDMLCKGEVRLGAKTNNGLGEVCLEKEQARLYHFDFSRKECIFQWLALGEAEEEREAERHAPSVTLDALPPAFKRSREQLCLDVALRLKNSLIIRSYSSDPSMPDAVHISSKGKPALTGSSLKGALRARTERILKTLGKADDAVETFIADLFGDVNEKKNTARKGRLRVRELILPDYQQELQTRIKIDRFTGGTIESALFDSMPLFNDNNQQIEGFRIVVEDCENAAEAGLLLLLLKDLWTGDLAVGGEKNVGRGVFQGLGATLSWKGRCFQIDEELNVGSEQQESPQETLQGYVDALRQKEERS